MEEQSVQAKHGQNFDQQFVDQKLQPPNTDAIPQFNNGLVEPIPSTNLEHPAMSPSSIETTTSLVNIMTGTPHPSIAGDPPNMPASSTEPVLPYSPPIQPLLMPETDTETEVKAEVAPGTTVSSSINSTSMTTQEQSQQTTPQKTIVTKVRLTDELNIFDWIKTKEIINHIAERARSSVDSVITVLDPGMKEYLYSGGNINIIVICDSSTLVSPIRDAFQSVFGRATVTAAKLDTTEPNHNCPIKLANGFDSADRVAFDRIQKLRKDTSVVPQNQVVVVVQPSLIEIGRSSDIRLEQAQEKANNQSNVYFSYCMKIEDPILSWTTSVYSHLIPLDSNTLTDLNEIESQVAGEGYRVRFNDVMNKRLGIASDQTDDDEDCLWLSKWAGLSEVKLIHDLGLTLAHTYRRKWNECIG